MSNNTILATAPLTATGYHLKATGTTIGNSLIWDNGTNVGIGNQGTTYTLDVTGTIRATGSIYGDVGFRTKSLNGYLLKNDADSANLGGLVRRSYWAGGAALDTQIFAETGYGIYLNVNGSSSTGMLINSSGNVGIGTTSPNAASYAGRVLTIGNGTTYENALELNGYNTIDDTLSDIAFLNGASSDADKRVCLVRANRSGANNSGALLFYTKNSGTFGERMRIYSNGNISIGTNIVDSGFKFYMRSTAGMYLECGSTSGQTALQINDVTGGSVYLRVRGDGYLFSLPTYANQWVGASANMYVASDGSFGRTVPSSGRFKENINDWSNKGLQTILALKPKTFKYKKDYCKSPDNIDFLGLIAEEVSEVLPYLAQYENTDRTGLIENVRYDIIVVPLIAAIQEQQIQIQNLQEQINILAK